MATTIHKYQFLVEDELFLDMPKGAVILSVGTQAPRHICVWAMVDPDKPVSPRHLSVRGTGHPARGALAGKFLGTVLDGQFVWHVFGDKE